MSRRRQASKPPRDADRRRRGVDVHTSSPDEILVRRARRMRSKGNLRKAAVALRELAARTEHPAHWVALGYACAQARRDDEAVRAYKQGMWLHGQRGDDAKARVVAQLILALDPTDRPAARLAA